MQQVLFFVLCGQQVGPISQGRLNLEFSNDRSGTISSATSNFYFQFCNFVSKVGQLCRCSHSRQELLTFFYLYLSGQVFAGGGVAGERGKGS